MSYLQDLAASAEVGPSMVGGHLLGMASMSQQEWEPIDEVPGFRIVSDRAYQGFDNDPSCEHHQWCGHMPEWYPEPRFWCRSISVERISDGARGWGFGPQADAYEMAFRSILNRRSAESSANG